VQRRLADGPYQEDELLTRGNHIRGHQGEKERNRHKKQPLNGVACSSDRNLKRRRGEGQMSETARRGKWGFYRSWSREVRLRRSGKPPSFPTSHCSTCKKEYDRLRPKKEQRGAATSHLRRISVWHRGERRPGTNGGGEEEGKKRLMTSRGHHIDSPDHPGVQ